MSQATVRATALAGWEGFLAFGGTGRMPVPQPDGTDGQPARSSIPLADFVRFSEDVVERTHDVAIPWLVGMHYDLAALGSVGEAINAAGKVGPALRRLVDHFVLLQDCTDIRLEREEDMAIVSYRILDPDIWPRHHDAMFTLGIVTQIIRRGSAGAWDKVEFAFEADQWQMRGDVAKVVDAPCTFGGDSNQIRFPAAMLELALPSGTNGGDMKQLCRQIVDLRRRTPLTNRLANVVFRDLNSLAIDQERIAREVGMSSRTMRRRLASEGSSFQQVLDECRMRQAVFEFRTRPELSIAQIALRLGYAEHSNFTRAFHRWSGVSPQAFRARFTQTTTH